MTSPRRDVSTSQRCDVVTSALDFHPIILKYGWLRNRGYREAYEQRHRLPEQINGDFEEVPGICTVSHC